MLDSPDDRPEVLAEGFSDLTGVAVDGDGNVWATEGAPGQLVRVEAGRLHRVSVGGSPCAPFVDAAGRIWFCDASDATIRRFDPNDARIRTICSEVDDEPLREPVSLAFDSAGNLLIACRGARQSVQEGYIACLTRSSDSAEMVANELSSPTDLLLVHHGATLLVLEAGAGRILRGEWTDSDLLWGPEESWAAPLALSPRASAAQALDGHLYVASGDGLLSLSPAGLLTSRLILPGTELVRISFDPTGEKGLLAADAKQGKIIQLRWIGPGAQQGDAGADWL